MGSEQRSAKAAPEDSMALMSQEKGSQRKRGRPAGRGIKKVKPAGKQAQRARAQIARKRAKICEYESDESDSRDKEPYEQDIDTREQSLDFYKKNSEPHETEKHANVHVAETGESSEQNNAVRHEDLKDTRGPERMFVPEIEMIDKHNDQNSQVTDKLEILTDPVQSMLFDMIPSLATKKVEETVNHNNFVEEKPPEITNAEPTTTKKKKVSYKDVAGELLKDW